MILPAAGLKRAATAVAALFLGCRINYKADLFGINVVVVNAAYTSKVCNKCSSFGKRIEDRFECPNCGTLHADTNAASNILKRKDDNEIGLYTPYKKVKEILEARSEQKAK